MWTCYKTHGSVAASGECLSRSPSTAAPKPASTRLSARFTQNPSPNRYDEATFLHDRDEFPPGRRARAAVPRRLDLSPGECVCTTRIAFNANCSFEDIRTLSRGADKSCQIFPDTICVQMQERNDALANREMTPCESRIQGVTAMRARYPFVGCAVTTAILIRCLGPIIAKRW
jgi:hypothetical protein